jgi:hypothetical protein
VVLLTINTTEWLDGVIDGAIRLLPTLITGGINPLKTPNLQGNYRSPPYQPCESFMGVNANYMYRYGGDNPWGRSVRGHLLEEYRYRSPGWGAHLRAYGWATVKTTIVDLRTGFPTGTGATVGLGTAVGRAAGSYAQQAYERAQEFFDGIYPASKTVSLNQIKDFPCRDIK